jgi:hypothetical protein
VSYNKEKALMKEIWNRCITERRWACRQNYRKTLYKMSRNILIKVSINSEDAKF